MCWAGAAVAGFVPGLSPLGEELKERQTRPWAAGAGEDARAGPSSFLGLPLSAECCPVRPDGLARDASHTPCPALELIAPSHLGRPRPAGPAHAPAQAPPAALRSGPFALALPRLHDEAAAGSRLFLICSLGIGQLSSCSERIAVPEFEASSVCGCAGNASVSEHFYLSCPGCHLGRKSTNLSLVRGARALRVPRDWRGVLALGRSLYCHSRGFRSDPGHTAYWA